MVQLNDTYESPPLQVNRRFIFGRGHRANIVLRRTFSNIFVTLTDLRHKVIICRTSGNSGVEGQKRKKRSALALEKIVKMLYEYIVLYNIEVVRIISRMKLNRYYYCLKKELQYYGVKIGKLRIRRPVALCYERGRKLRRR